MRYSVVKPPPRSSKAIASLALARRLKSAFPHLVIIFLWQRQLHPTQNQIETV